MAGFFTDFANNKILDQLLGGASYPSPPTLYFGLSQSVAVKSGQVSEPSGSGYARVPVANNTTNFPTASTGTKANAVTIAFPTPTGSWGTILSLFIADAAAGGNVLAMADLATPKIISSGNSPATIASGALFLSHT